MGRRKGSGRQITQYQKSAPKQGAGRNHPPVSSAKETSYNVRHNEIHKAYNTHKGHRRAYKHRHRRHQPSPDFSQIHPHGKRLFLSESHHIQFSGIAQEIKPCQNSYRQKRPNRAPLPHGKAAQLPELDALCMDRGTRRKQRHDSVTKQGDYHSHQNHSYIGHALIQLCRKKQNQKYGAKGKCETDCRQQKRANPGQNRPQHNNNRRAKSRAGRNPQPKGRCQRIL